MRLLAFLPCILVFLGGCAQIAQIPDDQLARDLNVGATQAVSFALKLAIRKSTPDDVKKIVADATIADTILQKTIIPSFSGASTSVVIRSTVDSALALLKNQIKEPRVVEGIDVGLEVLLLNVNLPATPTAGLDQRTVKALNGLFTGMAAGIEAAIASVAVPAPPRDKLALPNQ